MSIVEFYTNNLVDFYNVDEIKINMNNNNIYVQGDLRDYYNKYLQEQEQIDEETLQNSEDELNKLEKKYIQDSLRRLFNEGSVGLEVPSIENIFKAFIPNTNAMEKVDKKLSSSFSEMGTGMKTGATVMGKGMKTGATVMGKGMKTGATVMGKGMKTSYQSMKDQILKKMNKNRLIFILQHLSEEELKELEEYIERNNTITETDNGENKSGEGEEFGEFDEDDEIEMM